GTNPGDGSGGDTGTNPGDGSGGDTGTNPGDGSGGDTGTNPGDGSGGDTGTDPDEGSGGDTGTGGGGTNPVTGKGQAIAGGSALELTDSGATISDVVLNGDFTIEAWAQLAAGKNISAADAIISGAGFELTFRDGKLNVEVDGQSIAVASVDAVDGVWTHYAVVREDGVVTIYADGEAVGSSSSKWTGSVTLDTLADGQNYSRGFVGALDEVRVWDEARSQSEIADGRFNEVAADAADQPLQSFTFEDSFDFGSGTSYVESTVPAPVDSGDTGGSLPVAKLEVGGATFGQSSGDAWYQASFQETMDNPVVILGPLSSNGSHAAFGRVSQVTDTGFSMQIEEWDYLDGGHVAESVSWMALPSGTHSLSDGRQLVAMAVETDALGEATVDLSGLNGEFAVLTQIGTHTNAEAMVVRSDVASDGTLDLFLQRQEGDKGSFASETVYVVAVEVGTSDQGISAGVTSGINHKTGTVDFAQSLSDVELIASISSSKGSDPVALRLEQLAADNASVYLQEEQARDSEVSHLAEDVSWFAASQGLYDLG
ncbi:LamG domain-containing protein, partial [Salipiger sp. PrR002]|uniref:LamG domain-containing protein n=1 Tax=Salipiger sp. PrR002 TaxID=2706489 RepID=UPI0013BD49BD